MSPPGTQSQILCEAQAVSFPSSAYLPRKPHLVLAAEYPLRRLLLCILSVPPSSHLMTVKGQRLSRSGGSVSAGTVIAGIICGANCECDSVRNIPELSAQALSTALPPLAWPPRCLQPKPTRRVLQCPSNVEMPMRPGLTKQPLATKVPRPSPALGAKRRQGS